MTFRCGTVTYLFIVVSLMVPARTDADAQQLTPQQEVASVAGAREFHAALEWLRAHTREIAEQIGRAHV